MTGTDIDRLRECATVLVRDGRNELARELEHLIAREARLIGQRSPLTDRQALLLAHIRECVDEHGYAPTLDEIMKHFGWRSMATAHEHVSNLVDGGHIARTFNKARGITIL